ncbi:MAG: PAS domain S-box protein [Betaproteobacteria bacterium]|nr:PAS domain S-box protein [Betaproteobacteria bacterium]
MNGVGDRAASGALATQDTLSTISRRTVLVAGFSLILVVLVVTALTVALLRAQALDHFQWHLENLAVALGEQTRQSVHAADLIVAMTVEDIKGRLADGRRLTDAGLHERLRDRVKALPHVRTMLFIDRDGDLRIHNRAFPAPAVNYRDRDYFQVHRDRRVTGLHVGEAVFGRTTPEWVHTFTRRVEDAQGEFLGVVAAAVKVAYFQDFYRALKLGVGGRVFLFRSDGVLLTMYPLVERAVGRSFADDPLFLEALTRSESGVRRRAGFIDEKRRLVAHQRLPDLPLVVAVSMTESHALADWRDAAVQLGLGGAAMAAFIGLVMLLVLRQLRERAALKSELQVAAERLHGVIQSAMDAIVTVDEQQNVVFFNAAAERVFGCPAGEAIRQPLDRFIPERFRAAHRKHIERFGATGETTRMMGARLSLSGLRADGEEFPIDASISQVTIEGRNLFTVILRDITQRKRAEEALERSYQELRELSAAMHEVREAERMRIARELHDELAQWLTALKMDVSWLSSRLPREHPQLLDRTEKMKGLVDTTVTSVRRIAADLRPVVLDDLGLVAATKNLLHEFSQRTGVIVSHDVDAAAAGLGEPAATALYRMMQEALTNVARHAHATEVRLTLKQEEEDLVLRIRDNGRGIDAEAVARRKSYGVLGIRERAQTLGGRARVLRLEAGGTLVEIVIPYARYRGQEARRDQSIAR